MNYIEKRFKSVQEAEADADDLAAIRSIEQGNDESDGITLSEMDRLREENSYSGKISLRLPKTLHRDLVEGAKAEGTSLNQYVLFILTRNTMPGGA